MKLNKLAPLGLAATLAVTGCKEEKQTTETRSRITTAIQPSTSVIATAKPQPSAKPTASPAPKKPKIICHSKKVVLPGIKVIPRAEWAPLPPNLEILGNMENCNNYPIKKITLHHTGDGVITERGEGRKRAGGAVFYHLGNAEKKRGKGWGDVAYHYLITPKGEILEGRNPAFRGDSNADYYPGQNRSHTPEHHLLISLVGNYEKEEQELTMDARMAVINLIKANLIYYGLSSSDVVFHKDIAYTGCPGSQVIDWFRKSGKYQIRSKPRNPELLPK